ncbi:MAG: alpha/beta hydrolase [Desulfobacula sp.]|uniref:alpha/beta fold hydrolase n=1 Tax=Desulfobacula sp. TaxID=2593537 RepID=UPI001E087E55|nr:alpha/beta hydrolase [Desulfobacula sp.]MBT3805830.1 alpha/beta hydrolase [Desulfobacula sp.]MBT4026224.1 alpha/beta hydrolase [Desulfobacula sp.]MBT4200015.1 alpha/beta hydrolase [Desulfobacula sp.]MBT4507661.1 alpha/beta hydrolase [Desulfobacula sp.]
MTKFLIINSQKIEIQWYEQGKKNYPTLIFLHEGLGCTRMWKNFPENLSKKTKCPAFIFSRFGYGNSDPCPLPWKINFMHKEALTILPDIIKKAGIKTYILIGHSDGGSIGIILSGSRIAKGLKGLITMASHVFCEQKTLQSIHQAKKYYEQQDLKQRLEKYHGKNTENAFRGWNDVWLDSHFINWNIEKYLKKIDIPMLAIQGKNDQYGTIKQIKSIQRQVKLVKTEMIDDCGHSPHLEQQEAVLNVMGKFIHQILIHQNKS